MKRELKDYFTIVFVVPQVDTEPFPMKRELKDGKFQALINDILEIQNHSL